MLARCSGTGGRSGSQDRLRFGYMPEERGLYPRMPVGEQLAYFGACTGCDERARGRRSTDWLERLGLADRAAAKLEELSHGNQQRAQLAAALVHEPELLVLDEPFAGLDPVAVHTLADVLRDEAARGAAVLFSSHQLELVEDICEDVAIIDHGRIVATGDVATLRRASQRRRIELQLEGAPAAVAAGGCRRRTGRAPKRRSAAARRARTSTPSSARRGGTVRTGAGVQLRATLTGRAVPGAGGTMSARRVITLVARREIRERLRSKAFLASTLVMLVLVGGSAGARGGALEDPDLPRRRDSAGATRTRAALAARGEAVRRREGAAPSGRFAGGRTTALEDKEGRRAPAAVRRPARSSARASTQRPLLWRTPRCARSATASRRYRS